MARKLPALERVLGAPALFSVAYGEIASSIYFALGIVAGAGARADAGRAARDRVPLPARRAVLRRGHGGDSRDGRRRHVRPQGVQRPRRLLTGWVLFLDYLIVIALSALFLPHYLGGRASSRRARRHVPWDVVVGVGAIAGIALVRLVRRPGPLPIGIAVAVLDLAHAAAARRARLRPPRHAATRSRTGVDSARARPGTRCSSRSRSRCSRTRVSRPSPTSPRRRGARGRPARGACSARSALVVLVYVAIAIVGLSAFPVEHGTTALGDDMAAGAAARHRRRARRGTFRSGVVRWPARLRRDVGRADPARRASTTSISGFGRLAYSLGEHGHAAARLRPPRPAHAHLARSRSSPPP